MDGRKEGGTGSKGRGTKRENEGKKVSTDIWKQLGLSPHWKNKHLINACKTHAPDNLFLLLGVHIDTLTQILHIDYFWFLDPFLSVLSVLILFSCAIKIIINFVVKITQIYYFIVLYMRILKWALLGLKAQCMQGCILLCLLQLLNATAFFFFLSMTPLLLQNKD